MTPCLLTIVLSAVAFTIVVVPRPTAKLAPRDSRTQSIGCAGFPGLSVAITPNEKPSFFPAHAFADHDRLDQGMGDWYSKQLRAMNEPSLFVTTQKEDEVYRFLWLRSFHHPIAVRVWSLSNKYFLAIKELNGAGGYGPGKIIVNKIRPLTAKEWTTFTRMLEDSCFWNLKQQYFDETGKDGARWVVEGVKHQRYHLTDFWSPHSGDYRSACVHLLKISGLGIDEKSKGLY